MHIRCISREKGYVFFADRTPGSAPASRLLICLDTTGHDIGLEFFAITNIAKAKAKPNPVKPTRNRFFWSGFALTSEPESLSDN